MFSRILLHSIDANLGRVNFNSLSDQTLMEMLFEGFHKESNRIYQDRNRMYIDVCEWPCVKCDSDNNVFEISKRGKISGSLQLCYIPPKVKLLRILCRKLTGSVDLTRLPKDMESLLIHNNQFSGSIDLSQLPQSMENLNLKENRLSGSLDLTRLPQSIKSLFLSSNNFTGSVDLTELPHGMKVLTLYSNQFTGSFILTWLPSRIKELSVQNNTFGATAVIDSRIQARIDLHKSGVEIVIDEDGKIMLQM